MKVANQIENIISVPSDARSDKFNNYISDDEPLVLKKQVTENLEMVN